MPREFYVYILASDSRELYVGVTGNLTRRVSQHRTGFKPTGYTSKHDTKRLVYCETTDDVQAAILREKQIKGWARRRKLELIETLNPDWNDLLRCTQGDISFGSTLGTDVQRAHPSH